MADRERRLEPTTTPRTFRIIMGFSIDQEIGKHTAAARFIQKAIECMPDNVQQKYLDIYDKKISEKKEKVVS